ncbi:hypothetical protein F2P56_024709 [Juglans regia]|uniref:Uncharacterized protein n=1 Tax=Juglans regia TaxID=51240 RepID=A0A833UNG5_JUGRE|nr:hypothetical protein F2P56_024709 [Juglans regia]
MPDFWRILDQAREQKVNLHNLQSLGKYILSSSFDNEEYDDILSFLGVEPVNNEWYAACIQSSNLVAGVLKDLYLEILLFFASNWSSKFECTNIKNVRLIKYVGVDRDESLCSIYECMNFSTVVSLSRDYLYVSWLSDSSREFRCAGNRFFMPTCTQEALFFSSKKVAIWNWLQVQVKVVFVNVYEYAIHIRNSLNNDRKLAVAFVRFLYHSLLKEHLSRGETDDLCDIMPLIDNYGDLTTKRQGVIVPANGSKWVELIVSNPWRGVDYIELGEENLRPGYFAGEFTSGEQLLEFLKTHVGASDIPDISPPDADIPAVAAPLTFQNPPSLSFMLTSSLGTILQTDRCLFIYR